MLWKFATHCGKVGKKLVNTDMLKNFPSCYPGKLFRFSRLLEVGPQLEGSLWNWFHGQLLQNIKFRLNFPRISGSGHTQENSVKTSFHRTSWPERILLSNNPTPPSSPVRFCLLWWKASFPVWEMCQGGVWWSHKDSLLLVLPFFCDHICKLSEGKHWVVF